MSSKSTNRCSVGLLLFFVYVFFWSCCFQHSRMDRYLRLLCVNMDEWYTFYWLGWLLLSTHNRLMVHPQYIQANSITLILTILRVRPIDWLINFLLCFSLFFCSSFYISSKNFLTIFVLLPETKQEKTRKNLLIQNDYDLKCLCVSWVFSLCSLLFLSSLFLLLLSDDNKYVNKNWSFILRSNHSIIFRLHTNTHARMHVCQDGTIKNQNCRQIAR